MAQYVNLHPKRSSWAVYRQSGPFTSSNIVGHLNPRKYGGLSYKVLSTLRKDIYLISTESFGKVAIYVVNDSEGNVRNYAKYGDSSQYISPHATHYSYYPNVTTPNTGGTNTSNNNSSNNAVGKYLNLHKHMTSWAVYNVNGPYTKANAIGSLAPATYKGLSYPIIGVRSNDVLIIRTDSYGVVAIYAPVDNDSSRTTYPLYRSANDTTVKDNVKPSTSSSQGTFLNLHPHMTSWAVYNVNGPYTKANAIGSLAPQRFGGLSYAVLGNPTPNIYLIQTESFGKVAIYAPQDADSSMTSRPQYSEGNFAGMTVENTPGKKENVNYLNLHAHMTSWSVYNVNGPYTKDKAVGQLAPKQFGGLSYAILGNPSPNIYIIETESFGRVAIYAPRDNDSSITNANKYKEGNISAYETDNHYVYDYTPTIGDGTIDIKPRSYWGARPVQPSGLSGYLSPQAVRKIVVHHSASSNAISDIAAIQQAQNWHLHQDWGDIGYHIVIGRSGVIMEGRALNQIGAHAKRPTNFHSIGVCLLGNYESVMPPKAQMDSLIGVLVYLCKRFGVNASDIIGHRDAPNNATSCPGNQFYYGTRSLSTIRAAVRQALTPKPQSTELSPKKQQEEDEAKLWAWMQRFWNATRELDQIPRSVKLESWGPYTPLGLNARMRQGVFKTYKVGVGNSLLSGVYRSERTMFDSQRVVELRNILQDKLSELGYDGVSLNSGVELPNIGEILRRSSLVPIDHKVEFEINPIVQRVTLRHIATLRDIVLSKNRSVSIDLVIEIEIDNKQWFFPPAVVTNPVTVEEDQPQDIFGGVRFWETQVGPALLNFAFFALVAAGIVFLGPSSLSVPATAVLALMLKNE